MNLLLYSKTNPPGWNSLHWIWKSCQAFFYFFCTPWWKPVDILSSYNSISSFNHCLSVLSSIIVVISVTQRLGTRKSIGMTASLSQTSWNGVHYVSFLDVVLYSHSTVGISSSQSWHVTLHTLVSGFSNTLFNALTVPFVYGWYEVLVWWWIINFSINMQIIELIKWVPWSLIITLGKANLDNTFSKRKCTTIFAEKSLIDTTYPHDVRYYVAVMM